VTESYSGGSSALSIANSGSNRGISVSNSASSNSASALYGETYGSGAGLTGFNYGTTGPGGKFEVMSANSAQAAAFATTVGSGPAVLGTVTGETNDSPAIYGQNNASQAAGIGVEGDGSGYGVYGYAPYGVFGSSSAGASGYGVFGSASSGYGVYGDSSTGIGVYGFTNSRSTAAVEGTNAGGTAVFGTSTGSCVNTYCGSGVYGNSSSGYGVLGSSDSNIGVYGYSASTASAAIGIQAYSCCSVGLYAGAGGPSGIGLYAYSATGTALYVVGDISVLVANFSGAVAAGAYDKLSDRNSKQHFASIDHRQLLEKLVALPLRTWSSPTDRLGRRHLGPSPQDFHAAFHLNGDDDTRMSLSDLLGANLAAIQELQTELREKSTQLERLELQKNRQISSLKTELSAFSRRIALIERQRTIPLQSASLAP